MHKVIFSYENNIYVMTSKGEVFLGDIKVAYRELPNYWLNLVPSSKLCPPSSILKDCWLNIPANKFFGYNFNLFSLPFNMGHSGYAIQSLENQHSGVWFWQSPATKEWTMYYKSLSFNLKGMEEQISNIGVIGLQTIIREQFSSIAPFKYKDHDIKLFIFSIAGELSKTTQILNKAAIDAKLEYWKTLDRIVFDFREGGKTFVMFSNGSVFEYNPTTHQLSFDCIRISSTLGVVWKHFDRNFRLCPIKFKLSQTFEKIYLECFDLQLP